MEYSQLQCYSSFNLFIRERKREIKSKLAPTQNFLVFAHQQFKMLPPSEKQIYERRAENIRQHCKEMNQLKNRPITGKKRPRVKDFNFFNRHVLAKILVKEAECSQAEVRDILKKFQKIEFLFLRGWLNLSSDIAGDNKPSVSELERALDYFPSWRVMYQGRKSRKVERSKRRSKSRSQSRNSSKSESDEQSLEDLFS